MIKLRNILPVFVLLTSLIGIISCSDSNEDPYKDVDVKPGIYEASIVLTADVEENAEGKTRGIDTLNGVFSDRYPYNEIYLHSGDNSTTNHKVLRVPIDRIDHCKDCKGVNLVLEIKDDGGYIIRTRGGGSMELGANETVYFSTIDKPFWNAILSDKQLPFNNGHEIYLEDPAVNKELLRSYVITGNPNYNQQDLIFLFSYLKTINLSRQCNGFRLFVMFSKVDIGGGNKYELDKKVFDDYLKSMGITKLSINVYLGPYFCPKYDMYKKESLTLTYDVGGYYASDNQNYRDFTNVLYSHTGGGHPVEFQGFGFQTVEEKFLLAPIIPTNNDSNEDRVNITSFIRAYYDDNTTALKSFSTEVPGLKFEKDMTRMHFVVMAFDYRDLKVFDKSKAPTRNTSGDDYEEIHLKPLSAFCD